MEARAPIKKLTRRERLNRCQIPDDRIPKNFIDQTGLTGDIFEIPGKLDNEIVDLAFVHQWQQNEIATALKKSPAATAAEIHTISHTNPFNRTPFEKQKYLKELDEEIEAWIFARELEYVRRIKNQEKEEMLQYITHDLEEANKRLEQLLEPGNNTLLTYLFGKEHETNTLLIRIEMLNKSKAKLELGDNYYDDPDVLQYEISRLLKKQETPEFTDNDKAELALCYTKLDTQNRQRRHFMRKFRPVGLLQIITQPFNDESRLPTLSAQPNAGSDDM